MKTYRTFLSEAKETGLLSTTSSKLISHIHKTYMGDKKTNHSSKGANFETHTTGLSKDQKDKLGIDLKKAGWKYTTDTNKNGETAHEYSHPTEKGTTIVHVDHDPKGINSHLSNHVVTMSHKEVKRSPNYVHYD